MKCFECGTLMKLERIPRYHDKGTGLPNVYLANITARVCPQCGEREILIPNVAGMHDALAAHVIRKKGRLSAAEIRFLRKHMGWSSIDFAKRLAVQPETVSRWEHGKAEMSETTERLLRLLVAHGKKLDDYAIEDLAAVEMKPSGKKFELKQRQEEWELASV